MTSPRAHEPSECPPKEGLSGTVGIPWHDPGIEGGYASAFTISATRDEVVFLFGLKQACSSATGELTIRASDRIVLAPSVARRLLEQLVDSIRVHESRYGPLDSTPLPPTCVDRRPPPGPAASTDARRAGERASVLFGLVERLKVGAGYERSVKLSERTLLGNRFLLGLSKRWIGEEADERILDICKQLQMPSDSQALFSERLADANYVHFGFEENDRTCLYKVYLEFWRKIDETLRRRPDTQGPFLLHLGFKWDASGTARNAITRYAWYPWLTVEEILFRVTRLLDRRHDACKIVKGIVGLAAERIPHRDILYLEVTEDGNQRRSFDINTYRANLLLAELYPLWLQIGRHYSIPFQQMQAFYESIRPKVFGHISGGTDREGKDFLTVYYGVEGLLGAHRTSGLSMDGSPSPMSHRQGFFSPPDAPPVSVEASDEKAGKLHTLVQSLNVQLGFERSFKFVENSLLADRFLMGFKTGELRQALDEKILDICHQIEMPPAFLESFRAQLPEATIVLFGFEKDEETRVYKAYLEFGDRLGNAMGKKGETLEPLVIHLGFKWDASDNTHSRMTRYTCIPGLTVDEMLRRIWDAFYRQKDRKLILLVEGIVVLAATKVGPGAFLYFEAEEDNNPRVSFDINMYRANLRMEELYPLLLGVGRHYSVPSERLHMVYKPISAQIFGHLTGGTDRKGKDFLTIYFGEKGSSR